jgi:murein DD-endopeptidase MepM/ murein hydrolase activator NlpD
MRAFVVALGVVIAVALTAVWWIKFEHDRPSVTLEPQQDVVGRHVSWNFTAHANGYPGLRRIEILLLAGGRKYQVWEETFPQISWIGSRVGERQLKIEADLAKAGVPEGPARLEVYAQPYAWYVLGPPEEPVAESNVTVDLTPPAVELLTTQHNIRLGGSSVAVFRLAEDAVDAEVGVADYHFPAVRGYFADPRIAVAVFAVPQDLTTDVRPIVRAVDAAGNRQEIELPIYIRGRQFEDRTLEISDNFLSRKVPQLLAANNMPPADDLVEGYLRINRDLRAESEKRLRAATATSAPKPLWDGVFHRQSRAAPMSSFGDRRTYTYGGEKIDRQTHLGFDLASVARASVEATQNGVVVLAEPLGIYGNTVVIDHGLGVFSLYGHLSTIAVKPGQSVRTAEIIGQSGETGLAGGDHLHFSILVRGNQVDPVEWWDPKWMKDQVTSKLEMFPVAEAPAADEAAEPVPGDGGDGETRP